MRVLIYAINGVGLGHLNRLSCIALKLRARNPGAKIMFVTNSEFTGFFYKHRFKFVKLPKDFDNPLFTTEDFAYAVPKHSNLKILSAVVEGFKPDVALFDTHFPEEFVEECASRGITNYLVLREYDPGHIERFVHPRVRTLFKQIFIASYPQEVNIPNLRFVGPVTKNETFNEDVKRRYKLRPDKFNVLISSGGGGYELETKNFLNQAIRGCLKAGARPIVVSGPLFRGYNPFLAMRGVTFVRYEEHMTSLMRSVDFMISQAGYNACNEIVKYRVPALVLPVYRETDDQKGRAMRLADKGLCLSLGNWNEKRIARVISRVMKNPGVLAEQKHVLEAFELKDGAEFIASQIKPLKLPTVFLKGKNLTDVIHELRQISGLNRVVLIQGGFSWPDLLIVLEYLKGAGCSEIQLILSKPIPTALIKSLKQSPIVYVFKSIEASTISQLKDDSLPVVAVLDGTKQLEILKQELQQLLKLKVYSIQFITPHTRLELVPLANQRMKPEHFLFDISMRAVPLLPGKQSLTEKEIVVCVNQLKAIRSGLDKALEDKGILRAVNLLIHQIETLGVRHLESKEIALLEAQRYNLLNSKALLVQMKKLEDQLNKTLAELNALYDSTIKPLELERGWLYHERHKLLENAGVLKTLEINREEKQKLEAKKSVAWKQYTELGKELEYLEKRKAPTKTPAWNKIKKLELQLATLSHQRDGVWNSLEALELKKEQLEKEKQKELAKLPWHKQLMGLRAKLSKIEEQFSKIMKTKFDPVRMEISKLTASRKTSKLALLQKRKDKIWELHCAPLEQRRDLLQLQIHELESKLQYRRLVAKFDKKSIALNSKSGGYGEQLNLLKQGVKALEEKLERAKLNSQYVEALEHYKAEHEQLVKKQAEKNSILSELGKSLQKIEAGERLQLEKLKIKERYDKLNAEITKITKKIDAKASKLLKLQDFKGYLQQQRAHLLVSNGIAKQLLKIESELGRAYNTSESNGPRIQELKNKLNLMLLNNEVFDVYHKAQAEVLKWEQRIGWLKGY